MGLDSALSNGILSQLLALGDVIITIQGRAFIYIHQLLNSVSDSWMVFHKMISLLIYLSLCAFSAVSAERKLPPYLKPCKRYDPEISKCWEQTVIDLKPHLIEGIPEFDVPPITAFRVEKVHLDQQNTRSVSFIADIYNLTVNGGENYEVTHTVADFRAFTLEEGLVFPKLTITGDYVGKGRLLLLEFEGQGMLEGEFEDVRINGTWSFRTYEKRGKEHMIIDKDSLDVEVGKIYLYLHDIINGNSEITANINKAINENSDALLQDFKPLLHTSLASVINTYFNRVYSLFPLDVLLPIK